MCIHFESKLSKSFVVLLLTIMTLMSGCASSPKMQPVLIGDNKLTKDQLLREIQQLDHARQEIESKKGLTGTNVASALFFWPGLLYTYHDAGEANRLLEQRRAHLTTLYNEKVAQEEHKSSNSKV